MDRRIPVQVFVLAWLSTTLVSACAGTPERASRAPKQSEHPRPVSAVPQTSNRAVGLECGLLQIDASVWRASIHGGNVSSSTAADPENRELRKLIDTTWVPKRKLETKILGFDDTFRRLDKLTRVPIIISPDGMTAIRSEGLKVNFATVERLPLRHVLEHMCAMSRGLRWTIHSGVILVTSRRR